MGADPARRGIAWLVASQNNEGGWGGAPGVESSVEETALAVEILVSVKPDSPSTQRGTEWLLQRVENGMFTETTPIGFYFAKLWYFEKLYPLIFTTAALRKACQLTNMFAAQHAVHQRVEYQQTVSD